MSCECGCGGETPIALQSCAREGHVRGEPLRFIRGHNSRLQQKKPRKPPRKPAYVPASYETAEFADGRRIAQWFEDHDMWPLLRTKGHTVERRVRAWREGAHPDFHSVDRVMCEFHLHPSDLPEDVWLERV